MWNWGLGFYNSFSMKANKQTFREGLSPTHSGQWVHQFNQYLLTITPTHLFHL